ncbi:MAG: helix-turn-helix domain-containing protein [Planctomycetota bacterium]
MKSPELNTDMLLLDFPQAAKALGNISVSFLHSLDNAGKIIAPEKVGGRRLFSTEKLKSWIAGGCKSRAEMMIQNENKQTKN